MDFELSLKVRWRGQSGCCPELLASTEVWIDISFRGPMQGKNDAQGKIKIRGEGRGE